MTQYLNALKELAELAYIHSENEKMLKEKFTNTIARHLQEGIDLKEICDLLNYYNGGIYEKLKNKHPDLTQKDIEICCLILGDFSSQQICSLAKLKTVRSLYVRKSRIREKLNLGNNEKIKPYLENL